MWSYWSLEQTQEMIQLGEILLSLWHQAEDWLTQRAERCSSVSSWLPIQEIQQMTGSIFLRMGELEHEWESEGLDKKHHGQKWTSPLRLHVQCGVLECIWPLGLRWQFSSQWRVMLHLEWLSIFRQTLILWLWGLSLIWLNVCSTNLLSK